MASQEELRALMESRGSDVLADQAWVEALKQEAAFLLARLDELARSLDDGEHVIRRDFHGHVAPSMGRLRELLKNKGS